MTIQGLPDPYCDNAYADTINAGNTDWEALTEDAKTGHLQWGRVYIDNKYSCSIEDEVDDSVKTANAMLGAYNLESPLYDPAAAETEKANAGLTGKSSGAGSVFSKKSYDPYAARRKIDSYPDVTAVITSAGVCSLNRSNVKYLQRA